jgi:hypothetical protein
MTAQSAWDKLKPEERKKFLKARNMNIFEMNSTWINLEKETRELVEISYMSRGKLVW